jgi:hypothetical protein
VIERVQEQPARAVPAPSAALEWARERAWILAWWAGSRAVVLAVALVVDAVGPRGYVGHDERTHAFGLLVSWDGHWYKRIAEGGYLLLPGRQSDPAFFPLFAVFLRAGHAVGLSYEAAGLLVANVTLLVALYAFHALARELLGESLARRATVYVALFPAGYVFSMIYPQSFVLAAICFAGLAGLRGRWGWAAVWAAAGALARPEGAFVALPLLTLAWQGRRARTPLENGFALGAVVAPLAALASYPLYLAYVLHDPLAWSEAQSRWGRQFSLTGIVDASRELPAAVSQSAWVLRDLGALAVYLILLVLARRAGAPLAWQLAALAVVAVPAFSGSFNSIARFGLLAPAAFWGLAWLGRRSSVDRAIRIASVVLLVAATATIPYAFP